jgi:NAD(P)H-hydrate epimerase
VASIDADELARLIKAAARAHHAAFAKSDGHDPDWAIWYAAHLQAGVWDRLGDQPGVPASRGELAFLLVAADRAYRAADEATRGSWPAFYAAHLLAEFRGD